jgi:hypothetical protein
MTYAGSTQVTHSDSSNVMPKADNTSNYLERAYHLAQLGLGEARGSALSLRSDVTEEAGPEV